MPANRAQILVVEDESNLRRLFVEYLSRENYEVEEAYSGEAALEKISSHSFDLVITDLQMATLTGLDVLQAARTKDEHTQVLILTGFGSIATAVHAMQLGAYEYLTKPMHLEALGIKVRNALERRRLLLTLEEQQAKIDEQRRILERDLELARHVQASLVPSSFVNDHLKVHVRYLPMAWLGGDFADIYQDAAGNVYLSVIDVTGHGIAAALVVNRVCQELRKWVRDQVKPEMLLHLLNNFIFETFADTGLFLTMMCVKCELQRNLLNYAGSAHPAALLWQKDKEQLLPLQAQNPIIGFEACPADGFIAEAVPFHRGDKLFLYTDGLLEIENDLQTPLGSEGLSKIIRREILKTGEDCAAAIIEQVRHHGHGGLGDDMLLMVADFL